MTTTENLNKLFDRWQVSSSDNMNSFVRDGIINAQKFDPRRVLFLCKEPNQTGAAKEVASTRVWDFREWWKDELWGGFSITLGTWAHGVLSDFVPYDDISDADRLNAIHSVAFMNIKKSGGLGNAVHKDIYEYVGKHKEFIEEEIEIINPSFIIGSINCRNFSRVLFDGSTRHASGHGIDIVEWRGVPIIDFYHPSVRAGMCLSYALLKTVVQGDVFQNLLKKRGN